MTKIVAVIPTWRRPKILPVAIKCLQNAGLETVVVGSSYEDKKITYRADATSYVFSLNKPLGAKFNKGWKKAESLGPDYIMQWADDGLCTPNLLSVYPTHVSGFMGTLDTWFLDDRVHYFPGYRIKRVGETIGLGRLLSALLAEKLKWAPYKPTLPRGLDASLSFNLNYNFGYGICLINSDVRIISLKPKKSLTPIKAFAKGDLSIEAPDEIIQELLEPLGRELDIPFTN